MSIHNICIAGANVRPVVASAKRLGMRVTAITYFNDRDIDADKLYALQNMGLEMSNENLVRIIENVCEGPLLLTSKLASKIKWVERLEKKFELLGNHSEVIKKTTDSRLVREIGNKYGVDLPMPTTRFPCVVNSEDGKHFVLKTDELFGYSGERVEYIYGIPISASLLSDGSDAALLTINRQIIGERWLNADPLRYCGHVLPFSINGRLCERIRKFSCEMAVAANLVGSFGIDFVVSGERIYFMEINPRIQDTMESVEQVYRINMVGAHLDAVGGKLADIGNAQNGKFGKAILYAGSDVFINRPIEADGVCDIPQEGLIKKGMPICSIKSASATYGGALKMLKRISKRIFMFIK